MIRDESLPHDARSAAFRPLRNTGTALGQDRTMLELLHGTDPWLAAAAARTLIDGQHDALVRAAVATWPADAPDPAEAVRSLLALDD
ncbi:hypothetical protein [Actinoalloteichus hymeniacidonis]|uniref:Uncharacterized protein n=1 Tax=Actinoalloteichus hymeniacidonis TaxID=340345 RepID=A0AAC9MZ58_9PSEU|nr:hypothetical protein [Actinoalloteichus hymeniacidonis]AOS63586.1 hypothetical protein TL08_13860 [Actinoalloteichus hymeniacidonis]MBB5908368.1 hypothetical protein [Actinoalloteichus hymeniacidonis]